VPQQRYKHLSSWIDPQALLSKCQRGAVAHLSSRGQLVQQRLA
jgi:hypothetical protein